MNTAARMPVIFFGHGSPMNTPDPQPYPRPGAGRRTAQTEAILAISAHWFTRARVREGEPRLS